MTGRSFWKDCSKTLCLSCTTSDLRSSAWMAICTSSTIVALDHLYPQLSPGGYVIIDDYYGAIAACRKAVTDFRNREGIDAEINRVDWTGIWWRKPIAGEPLGIAKTWPAKILEGWLGAGRSRRS